MLHDDDDSRYLPSQRRSSENESQLDPCYEIERENHASRNFSFRPAFAYQLMRCNGCRARSRKLSTV
jgi:hypothetical protein